MAGENVGLDLASQTGQEDIANAINGLMTQFTNILRNTTIKTTTAEIGSLTITENGTYDASNDTDYDAYEEVVVNVPNSYESTDEGKVVSNGALVSQTSATKTSNGTYDTTLNNEVVVNVSNSYESTDEGKVVSNGALVSQSSQTITQNGTYDTTLKNEVVVNLPITGQEKWPFIEEADNPVLIVPMTGYDNVITFHDDYALTKINNVCNYMKEITSDDIGLDLNDFLEDAEELLPESLEYSGNTYGNSDLISDTHLVLLADCSDGSNTTVTLSDSITNYKAVLLNGIYRQTKTSPYNTSMLYINPVLNTSYWAGMKDRNSTYDCNVTFTSANEATLSGNKQVIIYGMP